LTSTIKADIKSGMVPKLLDIVEKMPSKVGVYYIHNQNGDVVYIGKSKNIKKRINQHFTGRTSKCKKIQHEAHTVSHDETGSELIALLKESEEIKKNKPIYNRAQRKSIFQYALYQEINTHGYIELKIQKADGRKKEITSFTSLQEGKNFLFRISDKHQLCQKLNGLYDTQNGCFQLKINECNGACINQEPTEIYNDRVAEFIQEIDFQNQNMIIIDKGRKLDVNHL
jgi:DNA polymerase-3 subunit epsilon